MHGENNHSFKITCSYEIDNFLEKFAGNFLGIVHISITYN
jgi:hypothetical protein